MIAEAVATADPAPRWRRRPEGSNWGDFGADDQLGSLNHIGADQVRAAVREVRAGLSFCLSLPLDRPGGRGLAPHRGPPVLQSSQRRGRPYFNYEFRDDNACFHDIGSDDAVTLSTQYSTQWDGFAHIGYRFDLTGDGLPRPCYYNGYRAGTHILPPELRDPARAMPLGIDAFAARPIQGRGVLVDIDRHCGRERRAIGHRQLMDMLRRDEIAIEPGDIVCLHTGYADEVLKMDRDPDATRLHGMCAVLDGEDDDLLAWIADSRLAAIAADNYAVEHVDASAQRDCLLPLHHHCLFKRGIPLGELWHLTELAGWLRAHRRHRFLLTAPPLRLPGAIGSPVTPVATV